MSLPIEWIEKIFSKLTLNYGVDFLARYKGIPIMDVKTDWSGQLAGMNGPAIAHALACLPDRAPTAQQFKNLCLTAPQPEFAKLAAPSAKQDPAVVAAVMTGLRAPVPGIGPRDWAKAKLRQIEEGVKVSPGVAIMARDALGLTSEA